MPMSLLSTRTVKSDNSVYWDECVFLRCVCAGMDLHLTALFIAANL